MAKVGDHKPPYDWRHGWIPLTPAAVATKRKQNIAGPPDTHVGALSDLTRGELLALTFYGQGGHATLHKVLGGKRAPDHAHDVITRTLDGLFKRPNAKVQRPTTAVRGVSQAQRVLGSKIGARVGKTFTEPRYVSTSGSRADAERYRNEGKYSARVYYDLAPGDPAIALDRTIRNHRATAQEVSKLSDLMFQQMYEHPEFSQEVLLPRGLRYQIVSDRLGTDGVREAHVRIIGDPIDLAISPGGRPADASPVGTPGGQRNWVDKAGGLPSYVRMVAHALMRQGKSESQAIQMAIGVLKNWASGRGNVSPKVRAVAAAAIAQWEAMKAGSRARSGNVSLSGATLRGMRFVVPAGGGVASPAAGLVDLAGHWKHGYIPLDIAAALSKAKGDRELAAKYLSGRSTSTPRVAGQRTFIVKYRTKAGETSAVKLRATSEAEAARHASTHVVGFHEHLGTTEATRGSRYVDKPGGGLKVVPRGALGALAQQRGAGQAKLASPDYSQHTTLRLEQLLYGSNAEALSAKQKKTLRAELARRRLTPRGDTLGAPLSPQQQAERSRVTPTRSVSAAYSPLHGRDLGNGYKLHETEPGKYGLVELRGPDGKVINSWRKDTLNSHAILHRADEAKRSHYVNSAESQSRIGRGQAVAASRKQQAEAQARRVESAKAANRAMPRVRKSAAQHRPPLTAEQHHAIALEKLLNYSTEDLRRLFSTTDNVQAREAARKILRKRGVKV